MSKIAMGQNGIILGTSNYFSSLNQGTFISSYMANTNSCDYCSALEVIAGEARGIISSILQDIQDHKSILKYVPTDRRTRLSNFIDQLSSICAITSTDKGPAWEVQSFLSNGGVASTTRSMVSNIVLEQAVSLLYGGGESGLDSFHRLSTLKDAAQYGESFAAAGNTQKTIFLQEIGGNQSQGFLSDVWDFYNYDKNPSEYCGRNGCEFCSDAYISKLESQLIRSSAYRGRFYSDYAAILRDECQKILDTIAHDVSEAQQNKDYLTRNYCDQLIAAVASLERCGQSSGLGLISHIQALDWYTPINTNTIRTLQENLNHLRMRTSVKEDGVYGVNTSAAYREFMSNLAHGTFPSLTVVNPLQTERTGIAHELYHGLYSRLGNGDASGLTSRPFFRADRHRYNGKNNNLHINVFASDDSSVLAKQLAKKLDHMELSPEAYNLLKNMENTAKYVKIAGKVLLVAGAALDVIEIGTAIQTDLSDADQRLGQTTISAFASVGGRWAGGIGGAKLGAATGAAIGTAILPGLGTLVGGAAGGLVLGVVGSVAGGELGTWVVDITNVEEWFR